jgi:branched-chain amino acid transport system permease protein
VVDQDVVVWQHFMQRRREAVRALVTDELVEEHRRNPRGHHSDALDRVLRFFRVAPIPGKEIVIESVPFAEYRIGVMTGVPGRPAELLDERYGSYDETLHAIFLRRVHRLREEA